jgi:hypothetical protein
MPVVPSKDDGWNVKVILDRVEGFLDFIVNDEVGDQYAFEDDTFRKTSDKLYLAIAAVSR